MSDDASFALSQITYLNDNPSSDEKSIPVQQMKNRM